MAIEFNDAKPGLSVFYQQPHMRHPEYGTIISINPSYLRENQIVRVLFTGDTTPKPCRPADLYWPPNFCQGWSEAQGQLYSKEWP